MKTALILILIFCFGTLTNLKGQTSQTRFIEKRNSIFFAPLNLFDFINPSVQLGFERMLNNRFALQVEGAYIINHSLENYMIDIFNGVKDCQYTNNGFKIRGEYKYFFTKRIKNKPYVSCEIFYLKNRSGVSDTYLISDSAYNYSTSIPEGANAYDDFFINDKQRFGLNLKFGIKIMARKWFLFEPHIGIGIVYRISKQYERENLNDKLFDDVLSYDNVSGNMWMINLPLNFKIGYRF